VCHQSVGLIARHLEAAGIPTIGLTSARSITAAANPPRSVFVDAPLGHTAGPPDQPETQLHIVRSALELGAAMTTPGTIDELDLRWWHDDWKSAPLSWSRRRDGASGPGGAAREPAGDSRTARSPAPQYQSDDDRLAAEAVDWDEQCRTCLGLPAS